MDGKIIIENFFKNKSYVISLKKNENTYVIDFISGLTMKINFSSLVNIMFNDCEYYDLDEQDLEELFYEMENNTYIGIQGKKSFLINRQDYYLNKYKFVFSVYKKIK
jgi:hypothetical protein